MRASSRTHFQLIFTTTLEVCAKHSILQREKTKESQEVT